MSLHLVVAPADAGVVDSPVLQGREVRVTRLLPHAASNWGPGEWRWLCLSLSLDEGLALLQALRERYPGIGVIASGAEGDSASAVRAYEAGADLFIKAPVLHEELMAAIDAQIRWKIGALASRVAQDDSTLELDSFKQEILGPQGAKGLTTSEWMLLTAFLRASDQAFKTEDMDDLFGASSGRTIKLTSLVYRLRRKLIQVGAHANCIRALRSTGYQLFCSIRLR